MVFDDKKTALMFKALGDENRIKIMKMLCAGERCACKILEELHITQPTLSHHMKILCDSGLVKGRKDGKWMYYSVSGEGSEYAIKCLSRLTTVLPGGAECDCC